MLFSPQAMYQAERILNKGQNGKAPTAPPPAKPSVDEQMQLQAQKGQIELAKANMKSAADAQAAAMNNAYNLQQTQAKSAFDMEKAKLTSALSPKVAQPQSSNPQVQQALGNQYYDAPALEQVPRYLGSYFS